MINMIKRIALLIAAFLIFTPTIIHAQTVDEATNQFLKDFVVENHDDAATNLGKFNTQNLNRVGASILVTISGGKTLGIKGYDQYYGKGLLPTATEYTASLFNRPVKTSVYVADVLKNTNLVPQAYAQGIGFAGLNPVLNIWKAFRNIAYFAFIIIFVIIGFMIMLRKKISSNAVVTIQEALPKIIITLILITFSYAIAGLMVDLLYFSIFILTAILQQAGLLTDASLANNVLFRRNIIGIGISYFTGFTEAAGIGAEAVGQLVAQVFGGLIGAGVNVIFYLIFAVAVLIAVFRTFIQLLMAYAGIILSTIFAPLQLLPNAFPGSDAFQKWLRGLFANVAVFPVAAAMVLLGVILGGSNQPIIPGTENASTAFGSIVTPNPPTFDYDGFLPPLLYGANAADGGSVSAVRALIGFAMIMLLPEVVKITKESLQVKEPAFGDAAWKNAMSGKEHGPAAWLGSGLKWGGGIVTGSISQAGATIIGHKVMQSKLLRNLANKAEEIEAEHQMKISPFAPKNIDKSPNKGDSIDA